MKQYMQKMQQLETALQFAVIKWSANSSIKNENALIEIATKIVALHKEQTEQTSIETEPIQAKEPVQIAARFFQEGNFSRGDRFALAAKFIETINKGIDSSMDWLYKEMSFYSAIIR